MLTTSQKTSSIPGNNSSGNSQMSRLRVERFNMKCYEDMGMCFASDSLFAIRSSDGEMG